MESFSLREKKKALQRISILEEMMRLLKTKELNEISIEELCRNVNTSKVTFFKYFSYKEQVLDYFVYKWLYDRSYEIHCQKYKGAKGLCAVFRSISEDVLGKRIMVSLANYYTKLTEKPPVIEISPYEYRLFNAEAYNQGVKPLELCGVFAHYLSGIKSIKPSQYNGVVCQLMALMYGVPIQTHIMELTDMYPFYEMGVKSILHVL